MIIDSHCHLSFETYDEERERIIQAARSQNVGLILNVATEPKEYADMIGVIEKYPLKGQLNILNDFLDVKHKYYRTEEYEKMYGADFLEIQKIVECELGKMKMN